MKRVDNLDEMVKKRRIEPKIPEIKPENWYAEVLRPDDMLFLAFEGINLKLSYSGKTASLDRIDKNAASFLIVHFPPQHYAEQAFFEDSGMTIDEKNDENFKVEPNNPDNRKTTSDQIAYPPSVRPAGSSRLVFRVPPNEPPIPYTLDAILDACRRFSLQVAPTALPPPPVRPRISAEFSKKVDKANKIYKNILNSDEKVKSGKSSTTAISSGVKLIMAKRWQTKSELGKYIIPADVPGSSEISIPDELPLLAPPVYKEPSGKNPPETSIEIPYRLILSPNRFAGWNHSTVSPKKSGYSFPLGGYTASGKRSIFITELWHTRLGIYSKYLNNNLSGITEDENNFRTLRAIWTKEWPENAPAKYPPEVHKGEPEPFRMSLDATDRENIVHLTSNFHLQRKVENQFEPYFPDAIKVNKLMLSSMGGWLDVRGVWDLKDGISPENSTSLTISEWRHITTMGRDQYARVVYEGYLFPFGHKASLVKITERKFDPSDQGNQGTRNAILKQRMFIVVKEPEKEYHEGVNKYDNEFPFTHVRILEGNTPNLDLPGDHEQYQFDEIKKFSDHQSHFWPHVEAKLYKFHIIAEDMNGDKHEFQMPLYFTDLSSSKADYFMGFSQFYENSSDYHVDLKNICGVPGQSIAFGPCEITGDTNFETKTLTFGAKDIGKIPYYYPKLKEASIIVPAVRHLTGKNDLIEVNYDENYVNNGFKENNPTGTFLKLKTPSKMSFGSSESSGGLIQPDQEICGLSRSKGPVGPVPGTGNQGSGPGIDDTKNNGGFNPKDFFPDAYLFGTIKLCDLLPLNGPVPTIITESLSAGAQFLQDIGTLKVALQGTAYADKCDIIKNNIHNPGDSIEELLKYSKEIKEYLVDKNNEGNSSAINALRIFENIENSKNVILSNLQTFFNSDQSRLKYQWSTKLNTWELFQSDENNPAMLQLDVELRPKSSLYSDPIMNTVCSIRNFSIILVPGIELMQLDFKKIEFISETGKKSDINVDLEPIKFLGALQFLNALKECIPLNGFSDPPGLQVTEEGITASYSLALPPVAVGVFSLQHMKLSAALQVPFIGDPLSVKFGFCEQHDPFLLTYTIFGGGGYFGITLYSNKELELDAALEFGGAVALNFGVASGSVEVMGGLYFKYSTMGRSDIRAYFKVRGQVDVIHLISASIELYVGMGYRPDNNAFYGMAFIIVEVDVFLFHSDVTVSCERQFSGNSVHPTFGDMMVANDWQTYCNAFAPIPEVD